METVTNYPPTPRLDLIEELHGTAVPDPYRWLEDPADERTRTWASAQGELMAAERASWQNRDRFVDRVDQLLGAGSISPTYWRGDRAFFMRRDPGQQFAVLYCSTAGGAEQVLIDPMALDPEGLTTLDSWQPTKEGDLLAYQLSEGGTEESAVYVMDLTTGAQID